jgi:uncharacterized repeat protein (TIGR01451 family)
MKAHRRVFAFLWVGLTVGGADAYAGTNQWTSVGPDGGWVLDAEFHPTEANILYVTAPSGFYRSTNGGRTWQVTKEDFADYPSDIAISTANPQRLVIASTVSGYTSTDGGGTFTSALNTPGLSAAFRAEVSRDGQTAYLASGFGLYRSTDQGQTWSQRAPLPGGGNGAVINALEIDPGDANIVYASSFQLGIFASEDGGASWRSLTSAWPDLSQPHNFVVDPSNPQRLLAATEKGLFISKDRGTNWAATSITEQLSDIDVDPTDSSTLYVSTAAGKVQKSTDDGASWTLLPVAAAGFREATLSIAPSQPSHLMLIGGNGVLISEDAGATWEARNAGIKASAISGFTRGPSRTYVATRTGGIFYLPTGGSNIAEVNNAALLQHLPSATSFNILDITTPNHVLFAVLDREAFVRSDDAGSTWTDVTGFPAPLAPQLLIDSPAGSQTLYAASGERIYKSTDAGGQWAEASTGLPLTGSSEVLALASGGNSLSLYAAVRIGVPSVYRLYRYMTGSASWAPTSPEFTEPVFGLAVHPRNDQILYAGIGYGLRRSTDGGATWSAGLVAAGGGAVCCTFSQIQFDGDNPNVIYAVSGNTVIRSVDAGEKWQSLGNVTSSIFPGLTTMSLDPVQHGVLLLGTTGFGIKQMTVAPDLALNLNGPPSLTVNTAATFSLTVRNLGPFDATNARVVANLPTGTNSISVTGTNVTCGIDNLVVTCTYPMLRAGADAALVTYSFTPTAAGAFPFSASITADEADAAPSNNNVGVNPTVSASASLDSGGGGSLSTELLLMLAGALLLARKPIRFSAPRSCGQPGDEWL